MSLTAINYALALPRETVTGSARLVLIVLAHHYNDSRQGTWPSVDTIACEAGLSTGQVRNHLRSLEGKDLIRVKDGTHAKGGRGCSRIYAINGLKNDPKPTGTLAGKQNKNPPAQQRKPTSTATKTHRPTGGELLRTVRTTTKDSSSNCGLALQAGPETESRIKIQTKKKFKE